MLAKATLELHTGPMPGKGTVTLFDKEHVTLLGDIEANCIAPTP